jgi:epoxyqueuosine reductase
LSLKEELIELVVKSVAESEDRKFFRKPLVGFSAADDPLYMQLKEIVGPEHLSPQDIFSRSKTVLSFFIPFSKEVVLSNRKQRSVSTLWAESYLKANALIGEISEKLITYLEGKGIAAATVRATHNFDEKTLKCSWSHRSAAYIAGLGKFGVNRMLITQIGSAGRYGTVFISHQIPADTRPEKEYCIYYQKGSCLVCVKSCPVNALDRDSFDRLKCYDRLLENSQQFTALGNCDVCGKCATAGPCAIIDSEKMRRQTTCTRPRTHQKKDSSQKETV